MAVKILNNKIDVNSTPQVGNNQLRLVVNFLEIKERLGTN